MREDHTYMLYAALASRLGVETHELRSAQHLAHDLGLTPLELIRLVTELEQSLAREFPVERLEGVTTLAELQREFLAWLQEGEFRRLVPAD